MKATGRRRLLRRLFLLLFLPTAKQRRLQFRVFSVSLLVLTRCYRGALFALHGPPKRFNEFKQPIFLFLTFRFSCALFNFPTRNLNAFAACKTRPLNLYRFFPTSKCARSTLLPPPSPAMLPNFPPRGRSLTMKNPPRIIRHAVVRSFARVQSYRSVSLSATTLRLLSSSLSDEELRESGPDTPSLSHRRSLKIASNRPRAMEKISSSSSPIESKLNSFFFFLLSLHLLSRTRAQNARSKHPPWCTFESQKKMHDLGHRSKESLLPMMPVRSPRSSENSRLKLKTRTVQSRREMSARNHQTKRRKKKRRVWDG